MKKLSLFHAPFSLYYAMVTRLFCTFSSFGLVSHACALCGCCSNGLLAPADTSSQTALHRKKLPSFCFIYSRDVRFHQSCDDGGLTLSCFLAGLRKAVRNIPLQLEAFHFISHFF